MKDSLDRALVEEEVGSLFFDILKLLRRILMGLPSGIDYFVYF